MQGNRPWASIHTPKVSVWVYIPGILERLHLFAVARDYPYSLSHFHLNFHGYGRRCRGAGPRAGILRDHPRLDPAAWHMNWADKYFFHGSKCYIRAQTSHLALPSWRRHSATPLKGGALTANDILVHLSNRRREVGPLPRRPGYAARCRCWRSRRRLTRPATARVRSVCLARWGRSA